MRVTTPRRRSARPPRISASALTRANQIGKPVNGRLVPAMFVIVPRTPPRADFGDFSVVWTPATPPTLCWVTGEAAGVTEAAGATEATAACCWIAGATAADATGAAAGVAG